MKRILDFVLIFCLICAPYFYLPHLLTGSLERWDYSMSLELRMAAVIRDFGLLVVSIIYIFWITLKKRSLPKPSVFFIIYLVIVINRMLLHGFSGTFFELILMDARYILGLAVILVFFLADWDYKKVNIVRKCLKLTSIPLLIFLIWEFLNPSLAVYGGLGRYRSTLYSPTVFGQLSGIIFIVSLLDLVYSSKNKITNIIFATISICLVFASGSRTTLLVMIITGGFLLMFSKMKSLNRLKYNFIIIILVVSGLLVAINLGFDIFSSRTLAIDISGDARLPRLISEWEAMTALNFLFGSIPNSEPPLDISWFVFLTRLGIFGVLSFLLLNISILISLFRSMRNYSVHEVKNNKILLNQQFIFIILFMSCLYLFTTNLFNSFPLNLYYWFGLGIGMRLMAKSYNNKENPLKSKGAS